MVQNQEQPVGKITFSILIALSLSHCLNDLLQSVLSASYPLFKDDLGLSFAQIGLITLVYQLSASVFQPITGVFFDKHRRMVIAYRNELYTDWFDKLSIL